MIRIIKIIICIHQHRTSRLSSQPPFHSLPSSKNRNSSSSNILKHPQTSSSNLTMNKRRKEYGNSGMKLAKQLRTGLVFVFNHPREETQAARSPKLGPNQFSKAECNMQRLPSRADHCLSFAFHILSLEDTRPCLCLVFSLVLRILLYSKAATRADHRLPLS